ncbi:hypothetical protein C488_01699 [Natrinema pellirubrum DSM 15624]|uniref:Uncharacterized protein n=1 Tax=Natrinema pellirubrum (strain DSM 15624 / CIP 106293 / JCM 10476 / NCIMB 786 / 157) TaxID=797303 RepID=L0JIK7_NATP1|nr:hypothetical protein [Natrinema pellirubrum]AGB31154.1 hypothetical protein Natpe_1249 [Natrinema pellirubrum DSM 15624]ELY81482.1 hypothetical protein C488_01699 [Natrinema pellirubrum DSM 15624]
MSEGPVTVDELAAKAESYLHESSLTPAEYEALKHSVTELAPLLTTGRSYFVLGSYGRPEIHRLQLVKDRLNRRTDSYAFLMVDIRNEWTNTYLKFRLIADYADYIVGVSEHDSGGFLVEQGYFTALEQYFEKTYILKRTYDDLTPADIETEADPENPYSGMQTAIFEMLADEDRLCVWETEDDLRECTSELP